jgi:hypothetical protein
MSLRDGERQVEKPPEIKERKTKKMKRKGSTTRTAMKRRKEILETALKRINITEASTQINLINTRHLNDCCFVFFHKLCWLLIALCLCICAFFTDVGTHMRKTETRNFSLFYLIFFLCEVSEI